jgi:hypothetical protein
MNANNEPIINPLRTRVVACLCLDASAGQGVPEDVWLRLAAVLAAKQGRGKYLRPIQERRLRLGRPDH